jgi:hypothetical protein
LFLSMWCSAAAVAGWSLQLRLEEGIECFDVVPFNVE